MGSLTRSLLAIALSLFTLAATGQTITWDGNPITVELPSEKDRRVVFDVPVWVDVPHSLETSLETEIIGNTIYWKAGAPFEAQRVIVGELNSDRQYVLYLTGIDDAGTAPVMIHRPRAAVATTQAATDISPLDPIKLSRFMAHELYAPERLRKAHPEITRVFVNPTSTPSLVFGHKIEAEPAAAWQSGPWHLTAVILKNKTSETQELDPRELRGAWSYTTFQHGWLGPAGQNSDTTAVYLISERPFWDALKGLR